MSKTNLGKVSICPKGKYDATTTYNALDVVSYGTASWMALQDCKGVTPIEGAYWMKLVDITKDGIVDALGYEPAEQEGEIELIQSVTLTQAAAVVFNGFSLKYAYFESILPAQETIGGGAFQFYTENTSQRASYISGVSTATSSVRTAWAEARQYGGRYFFMHSSYTPISDGQTLRHTSYALSAKTIKAEPIIRVRYTPTCPVGTIANLYGIRA